MKVDEQTFIEIYDEFAPKIFKYVFFRVSSREEAEDIAAQTFTRAWDYVTSGKTVDNAQAFLFHVAHNLVIDHYRRSGNVNMISIDNPNVQIDIPTDDDYDKELDHKFAINEVRQKLQQLPDNYREAITLRYINDLSVKEIAKTMGVTENNASVILHRATEKLKKLA